MVVKVHKALAWLIEFVLWSYEGWDIIECEGSFSELIESLYSRANMLTATVKLIS